MQRTKELQNRFIKISRIHANSHRVLIFRWPSTALQKTCKCFSFPWQFHHALNSRFCGRQSMMVFAFLLYWNVARLYCGTIVSISPFVSQHLIKYKPDYDSRNESRGLSFSVVITQEFSAQIFHLEFMLKLCFDSGASSLIIPQF